MFLAPIPPRAGVHGIASQPGRLRQSIMPEGVEPYEDQWSQDDLMALDDLGEFGSLGRGACLSDTAPPAKPVFDGLGALSVQPAIQTGLDNTENYLATAAQAFKQAGVPGSGVAQTFAGIKGQAQSIRDLMPAAFDLYQAVALQTRVQKLEAQAKALADQATAWLAARGGSLSGLAEDAADLQSNMVSGSAMGASRPAARPAPPPTFLQRHGKKIAVGLAVLYLMRK